jgi:hypothetical protein
MIPTVIAFGLVFGRWWRFALIAAALGWPAVLVISDVMDPRPALLGAAGLAAVNAGVGVLVHQGVRRGVRAVQRHDRAGAPAGQ